MNKPSHQGPVGRTGREHRLLRALYLGALVLLALFLWSTYTTYARYLSASRNIRNSNAVLHELDAMVSGLKDAHIGVHGYLLTRDSTFLRPFRNARPVVEASIGRLDSMDRSEMTGMGLATIRDLGRELLDDLEGLARLGDWAGPVMQGAGAAHLERAGQLMDRLREEHGRLASAIGRERDSNLAAQRNLQPDTPLMLAVFSVLAILATALLFLRLFRALAKAAKAEEEVKRRVEELDREVGTRQFAERSLRRVLDTSPSAIMAFRTIRGPKGEVADFECILSNSESDRIYGQQDGKVVGKRLLATLPWIAQTGAYEALRQVVETGRPHEDSLESLYHPGTWIHVHAVRLLDGFVITISDITEARRARNLLAESDRLAITGGIARTIAHEVRNPLTNLHMALEQMLDELEPAVREEVKPFSDILMRNMNRISKLITDLLESSRPKELDLQPCNVRTLLEEAVASVQDRLDLLEMKAVVEVADAVPGVMADPALMSVALTNLCVNAIEAMEKGRGRLVLKGWAERGRVLASISDNGKGISPENIQRLFQAFFSGHSGGMGLGLTSARSILNAHQVHLDVESAVGEGTTFTLTFP